ncbi:molybdenum cofactor guanylyltransferase [Trueperella bialowiezensis]|uniref:Molybdopterin-guanine dinucleotide biosynthesis protein MobA n=1 Tax=Trueperella bialowiezensis TaxID=312285 RepID=A0A3S5EW17_9ACTO|nr:NTP transferase domain-containing protein [Trueperella bialowiezensis]VEI13169.1 molybdopterin-guanine dinucleotide biosynthesis protein MobA [Trueperella bialowiezensis]
MNEAVQAIIILGGGTGARLGGVSKPEFRAGGRRLIDILFDQLGETGFAGRRVLVAPRSVEVPPGVLVTLEDPPHGGPVAGIGAGLTALHDIDDAALIALATCDAPVAVRLLPELATAIGVHDGAVPVNPEGWPLYTHGVYRAGALRTLDYPRNASVRAVLSVLDLTYVEDTAGHCIDVDEPADVPVLLRHLDTLS